MCMEVALSVRNGEIVVTQRLSVPDETKSQRDVPVIRTQRFHHQFSPRQLGRSPRPHEKPDFPIGSRLSPAIALRGKLFALRGKVSKQSASVLSTSPWSPNEA